MNEPFASEVLSVTSAPPGFSVDVWHYETPPGGQETAVERRRLPVVAWAVVKFDAFDDGRADVRIEPVFLWNSTPTHTSQYRWMFSDLRPAAGEPKKTVGIDVCEPVGYAVL
jgi:hypothetical protein